MSLIQHTKPALIFIVTGAMLMLFVARMIGHTDIIMPTFGALMTGGWLIQDNLWHYHRFNLFLSMALAACIGLSLAILSQQIGEWFSYIGILIGFQMVAAILVIGRTQIYPCFGAFSLPLIFQTTSWWYPVSVATLAGFMLLVQWCLEKSGIRHPLDEGEFPNLPEHRKDRMQFYLRVSTGLIPILVIIPVMQHLGDINVHLLLQAPLFVTYTTFCNEHSTFIRFPKQTWAQLVMASAIGMAFCWLSSYFAAFLSDIVATPICVGCSVALTLFLAGRIFVKRFPPAISMAITPFLATSLMTSVVQVVLFPLFIAVAAAYCIFMAWVFRRHPKYENMDLHYL